MHGMAKRRTDKVSAPPRVRKGTNLNVWLPDDLMEAFESLRAENRRTHKAEVEVMMEDYLKRHGRWPPPENE